MISFVDSKNIHRAKYDSCIENAIQSRVYAYSWYLDIVCENWGALVLDDYQAVMPVPWNKKYGIRYVYPPLWVLELGIFTKDKIDDTIFLEVLLMQFKFIELRMNTQNEFLKTSTISFKKMQWLSMSDVYETLVSKYRKDRKKDLQKARKLGLKEVWNDDVESLVELFKNNIGKRDKNIKEADYKNLQLLLDTCIEKKVGELLSVYDECGGLVASAFFIKHHKTVTILLSSTDLKNRKNGANTFLIDSAIRKYHKSFETFNFGGSSMETIASYFKGFNADESTYGFIKQNNLPFFIRLLKR